MTVVRYRDREFTLPDGVDDLTSREMRVFKKASGLTLGQVQEAAESGDWDVLVGLLAVAIHREDGSVDIDALIDEKIVKLEVSEQGADVPPTGTSEPAEPSGDASESSTETMERDAAGVPG